MEPRARKYQLKKISDVWKFFKENSIAFTLINAASIAVVLRTITFLKGGIETNAESVLEIAGDVGFVLAFSTPPFILALYFIITWTFRDVGLKVITPNPQHEIITVHGSLHNLMLLMVGFSTLTWLAEKSQETNASFGVGGIFGAIILLIVFFMFMGGMAIFMGVMYYRSGAHEQLVNFIRHYIAGHQGNPEFPISIGMIRFEPTGG